MYVCMYVCIVDQEILAINNFSPVAKFKHVKIKYTYTHYIAEPSGSKIFLPRKFPNLRYVCMYAVCMYEVNEYMTVRTACY